MVVAAVAAAAVVDTLRNRETESAPPPEATVTAPTPPRPDPSPALVSRLRSAGLAGQLVLVGPDCTVRALALPDLAPAAAPSDPTSERACAAPSARRLGVCGPGDDPACLPTVRPGGSVVVVREGGLWARAAECPRELGRCWAELLSSADLGRTGAPDPRVVDHVWLTPGRAAVLLAWPGGGYVLGVYEGRELLASHRWGGEGPGRLEAAPGGTLLTARPARLFRSDGTPLTLAPRFRNARAVDWSPDGNWAALAMVGAVVLVETQGLVGGDEAHRAIRLPYPARDLAWLAP